MVISLLRRYPLASQECVTYIVSKPNNECVTRMVAKRFRILPSINIPFFCYYPITPQTTRPLVPAISTIYLCCTVSSFYTADSFRLGYGCGWLIALDPHTHPCSRSGLCSRPCGLCSRGPGHYYGNNHIHFFCPVCDSCVHLAGRRTCSNSIEVTTSAAAAIPLPRV